MTCSSCRTILAATNKSLAKSNKSCTGAKRLEHKTPYRGKKVRVVDNNRTKLFDPTPLTPPLRQLAPAVCKAAGEPFRVHFQTFECGATLRG
jgi:hypothetical protein